MYFLLHWISQLLRLSRLLSKYYTLAQLDQQKNHSTPFADSFSNPTGGSGEMTYQ